MHVVQPESGDYPSRFTSEIIGLSRRLRRLCVRCGSTAAASTAAPILCGCTTAKRWLCSATSSSCRSTTEWERSASSAPATDASEVRWLVGWSLTPLFSTNTAISETETSASEMSAALCPLSFCCYQLSAVNYEDRCVHKVAQSRTERKPTVHKLLPAAQSDPEWSLRTPRATAPNAQSDPSR